MNLDMIESEVENCLRELRSICEHLEPQPRMCDSKKSPEPKSPHGDVVAQYTVMKYTVTNYADGTQEWKYVADDQ